jgi:uncharacterized protein (TIGR00730 family)
MDIPETGMEKRKRTICVFCGSSSGSDPRFAQSARLLGQLIARHGFSLVFGGGGLGLMGEVARAARDGGAAVTGILPEFLRHLEPPLAHGEQVVIVPDLFVRKHRMVAMANAFVLLPGGTGTLDEFFEVVTSAQLAVHAKPVVLVNVAGYYDPLLALLKHTIAMGFARAENANLYSVANSAEEAMDIVIAALHLPQAP